MSSNQIKPGGKLPHFIMMDEKRNPVDVSSFTGKYLILYFYPKDNTPGCIKEAQSFCDSFTKLVEAGAFVVGVSSDSPQSHAQFKKKYNIPYPLLADTNGEFRKLMGVPASFLGLMPGRVTYIFNPEGILIHIFDSQFSPEKHVQEALKVIGNKKG